MLKHFVAIAILAGIVSMAVVTCGGDDDQAAAPAAAAAPTAAPAAAEPAQPAVSGITRREGNVVDFTLKILPGPGYSEQPTLYQPIPFLYDITEMTFNVGDTVNFTVVPTDNVKLQHTLNIDDLGIRQPIKFGKTAHSTVTFDKPGTYRYRCEVHTGEGESGLITVK